MISYYGPSGRKISDKSEQKETEAYQSGVRRRALAQTAVEALEPLTEDLMRKSGAGGEYGQLVAIGLEA